jgi:hypothetical protein
MESVLLIPGFSTCENARFRLSMLLVPHYQLLRKVFANRNCFSSSHNICLYLQSPSEAGNRRWDNEHETVTLRLYYTVIRDSMLLGLFM